MQEIIPYRKCLSEILSTHDDVTKWKHFPRYWPFVRGIDRSPVNSPPIGQGRGALMFSLICAWINGWVNNREARDLRSYRAHYDVTVIVSCLFVYFITKSFLTYSFFPPTPALSTISRPLSSYKCPFTPETTNVCSSYNRMRGPSIGCWFSDRSNCSHWSFEAAVLPINPNIYTDQWEPIVMYHSITFTFIGPYTTMQPTLLTSWLQLLSYKV